ncbi:MULTISPECIES: YpsA SLOG family protein [Cupriavidus]
MPTPAPVSTAATEAVPLTASAARDLAPLTLVEHASPRYGPRTRQNAACADVTLAFAIDFETRGEKLTRAAAGARYEDLYLALAEDPVITARMVYRTVVLQRDARVVNVAGNGLHTLSRHGIEQAALNRWLYAVLAQVQTHYRFERVISGGQTGVDTAGLVVALVLGIPAVGMFPKGFLRRSHDGVDYPSSDAEVRAELIAQARVLRDSVAGRLN